MTLPDLNDTTSKRTRLIGTTYVLGAIVAWGIYFPFARLILQKITPEVFLVFRLGIGSAVLLLMTSGSRRSSRIARGDVAFVLLAGVVGIILHQVIQLNGLRHTTATNTGWILTLIPPVTGLLAWIFIKEKIARRQIVGLTLAIAGVLLFVSNGRLGELSMINNRGDMLALVSVGTWSIYTVMVKSRLTKYAALPMTTLHMGLGFIFFAVIAGSQIPEQIGLLNWRDWVIITVIGIVPSGLAYYWWNAGLQKLTAVNTSVFLFIEAIVASVVGFLLLGEHFTLVMLGAAVVIIAGVLVTQKKDR